MNTVLRKIIFIFLKKYNLYICISYVFYTLTPWLKTYFTLENCLFGSVKLSRNVDPGKKKYSGYGIGFDSPSEFLFTVESLGKNVYVCLKCLKFLK